MFYTFLKKLVEIESRIKKLERAYFYLVNDYTGTDSERPSAASIIERQHQILNEISEQAENYIATHRQLADLVDQAEEETETIRKALAPLLDVESEFGSADSEENCASLSSEQEDTPSPTVFISRGSRGVNQNPETPAVRKSQR